MRVRVRAAAPSGVREAELLASGDCGSALVDVSLLLAAARDGVGLTCGRVVIVGGASQGGTVGANVSRLQPRRANRRGGLVASGEGTLCRRRCLVGGRHVSFLSRTQGA